MTDIAEGTIRSVVLGVVGIALIQAILAGAGMLIAGIPATGVWVLLVLIFAIMQLPILIILLPVAIYAFTVLDTFPAVIFLIWCIIVGLSDTTFKRLSWEEG